MRPLKPGWKSSEFWFTFVSFVFSGLYLVGLIGENSQKEDLIQETSRGVEAAILIIGQLTVLFRYVKGRTELKKLWWNTASEDERKEVNKPVKPKVEPKPEVQPKVKPKKKKKTTTRKKTGEA